ncbi:MAG: dihydrodipicolinate reductase [Acidimicrobiia bacterium]
MGQPLRIVQWATGNIGSHSLRAVIQHPDLELVGTFVYSADKSGKDAGTLCGVEPVGVVATSDVDEIVALDADCVVYMADRTEVDVLVRLLESGKNVVATRSEFHRPAGLDPETRTRIEGACTRGGTSLHSTGSSPGFISEAMPIVLTSIQRRLDVLEIDEFADMSSRNSPEMIFRDLGFGRTPDRFDPSRLAGYAGHTFGASLRTVGDGLGLPLDDVVTTGEVAVSTRAVDVAAGRLEGGTVGAIRLSVSGLRGGRPTLVFRANWYLTTDLDPAWDLRETGWRVVVQGDAPLDIEIRFPVAEADYPNVSPGYTANRAVNAIPYVCAAEPGIRTTFDLPQIVAALG